VPTAYCPAFFLVILRRAEPDEGSLYTARDVESEILRFAQDDKEDKGVQFQKTAIPNTAIPGNSFLPVPWLRETVWGE